MQYLPRLLLPCVILIIVSFAVGCHQARENGNTLRIAGIVLKWIPRDREANFRRAEVLIRQAASKGAKFICTTESFLDGYSARDPNISPDKLRQLAEPIPSGRYFAELRKLADELNVYLVAALTELDGQKLFNTATLIGPDGVFIGKYRKKFLWADEVNKYTAGESFPTFNTEFGKVGMMICSDRRQPEAIEALTKNGAVLVFCPAGGGYGNANDQIVSQRSKEGKVPIVFVHPIEFLITGPSGKILKSELYGDRLDEDRRHSRGGIVRLYDLPLSTMSPANVSSLK